MTKKTLEMCVSRVRLDPSASDAEGGERILIATLIWPRPLMAERISSKSIALSKGMADLSTADWTERILFKENVEGAYGLILRVTETLSEAKAARFLAQWGEGLLKLAGSETTKLASGPWSASLARIPLQLLAAELGNAAKDPAIVAAGRMTLNAAGEGGELRIPLKTIQDHYRTESRRIGGRKTNRRIRTVSAGEPAGEVELELKYW